MKLVLNSFFLFFFLLSGQTHSEEIYKKYTVKVSGIKIGKLEWWVQIDDAKYLNKIKLNSGGLLSAIYKFEGEYLSEGVLENKKLKPTNYRHLWKTNKATKKMDLIFHNEKLLSLKQSPLEKEHLRVDVFNIKQSKDPLTSFLQIIMGEKKQLVVDGRRIYVMNAVFEKNTGRVDVEISNYSNLWADHKRSKFEKISFQRAVGGLLPVKINIYFDQRVFKLE